MPLQPDTTFSALALMNQLVEPMYFTPLVTSLLANAFVGVRRIRDFLLAPEIEADDSDEYDLEPTMTNDDEKKVSTL